MDNPEVITEPLIILGTIWLGSSPVLTAVQILHNQRELVLGIKTIDAGKNGQRNNIDQQKDVCKIRENILYYSYIPIFICLCTLLTLLTSFLTYSSAQTPLYGRKFIYGVVALQPFISLIATLYGGINDIKLMNKSLCKYRRTLITLQKD